MTPLDLMQRFYDSEFGPPGDFGSGVADALAVRKALKKSFHEAGAAEAFEAVLARAPDTEKRLRFSAVVAQLSDPRYPENKPANTEHVRLRVHGVAAASFIRLADSEPLTQVLNTLTQHVYDFCGVPHVEGIARSKLLDAEERLPAGAQSYAVQQAIFQLGRRFEPH